MYPTSFGCFSPALHNPRKDPYLSLLTDIELCVVADQLGFDEFWIGEHHSGGWGSLSSPEVLLAALARETRQIKLCTGVVPLVYHHPLHVAERVLLLDYLSNGRAILGCGPGAYVQDMAMIGLDPSETKQHFSAALRAVSLLLRGHVVDMQTPWFTLREASAQLRPFRRNIELVAATSLGEQSVGPLLAARANPFVGLTPFFGAVRPGIGTDPIEAVAERFAVWRDAAPKDATTRLSVFVHVCESREAGLTDIFPGWLDQRLGLFRAALGVPIPKAESANRSTLEMLIDHDAFVVGKPEECVSQIRSLAEKIGGFDTLIILSPGWASPDKALASLKMFARDVAPHFSGRSSGLLASFEAARGDTGQLSSSSLRIHRSTG